MPSCEICGKNYDNLNKAIVESVMMDVCENCGKFGKVVSSGRSLVSLAERKVVMKHKPIEESIVGNYHNIIKKAREDKGLKQEELAKSVAEKESIIHKIETGSLKPSIILAKKLEHFLDINLVEIVEEKKEISFNLKDSEMTIGDMLKIKKRKI